MHHDTSLNRAFHALSDPTRRAVIHRLIQGPAAVKELADPFEMGLPSFMKHIRVLEDSGLIDTEKAGRTRTCRINIDQMDAAQSWLDEQRVLWEARIDRLAAFAESMAAQSEDNGK